MTRPEDVRCENCCYWFGPYTPYIGGVKASFESGDCRIRSQSVWAAGGGEAVNPDIGSDFPEARPDSWCGEFRKEWPLVNCHKWTMHEDDTDGLPRLWFSCSVCGLKVEKL